MDIMGRAGAAPSHPPTQEKQQWPPQPQPQHLPEVEAAVLTKSGTHVSLQDPRNADIMVGCCGANP